MNQDETDRAETLMIARGISEERARELSRLPGANLDLIEDVFRRASVKTGFGAIMLNIERRAKAQAKLEAANEHDAADARNDLRRTSHRLTGEDATRAKADDQRAQARRMIEAAPTDKLAEYVETVVAAHSWIKNRDPKTNSVLGALVVIEMQADGYEPGGLFDGGGP